MIAAARRRIVTAARRRVDLALWWATKQTRRADRAANRRIERAQPVLWRARRGAPRKRGERWAARAGGGCAPSAALFFRASRRRAAPAPGRGLRRARAATRASAVVTPQRAICAVVLAAAACLIASQFVDYRAVEIGQPGYAGLPTSPRRPPSTLKTAGDAHSYLLVPLALLAAALGVAALRPRGGAASAGRLRARPAQPRRHPPRRPAAGLDAGAQTSRFAGATAVLYDGFYAQLAAAAG